MMKRLRCIKRSTVLDVLGLGLVSFALGLWLLPVGIGAAGVSLILLSWKGETS